MVLQDPQDQYFPHLLEDQVLQQLLKLLGPRRTLLVLGHLYDLRYPQDQQDQLVLVRLLVPEVLGLPLVLVLLAGQWSLMFLVLQKDQQDQWVLLVQSHLVYRESLLIQVVLLVLMVLADPLVLLVLADPVDQALLKPPRHPKIQLLLLVRLGLGTRPVL